MTEKLTSSREERPARISVLPGSDWDSKVNEAFSLSTLYDCALNLESAGLCGKTSPLLYPAGTARILQDSSLFSADGNCPSRTEVGVNAESSPTHPDISAYRGEYLILNLPEWNNFRGRSRSEGSVSSLSDILVTGVIPPRYYLTVKCAVGILRRAARRGKELPPVLKEALIRQSGGTDRKTPEH